MSECQHKNISGTDWPDGGCVQICKDCGKSRHCWEQGESDWIMVEDVEEAKARIQQSIDAINSTTNNCDHIIVDARNEVIKAGYICIKCHQIFEAGDH